MRPNGDRGSARGEARTLPAMSDPAPGRPGLSVVVPSRDRAPRLAALLGSLRHRIVLF
jgi:hypothetical protein